MEHILAFSHGFILALGLILPLGVQNVFVFTQGAYHVRFSKALPAVVAASICDTLLILLAVCGVSVMVLKFHWLRLALIVAGVAFLTTMGWVIWRSKPDTENTGNDNADWPVGRQVLFAVSVSLLNPHAIIDTVGVIGTSSLSYSGETKVFFALACIAVSWLWFMFLALTGRLVKRMDGTGRLFTFINKTSAVIMWFSAVYLVHVLLY